ncbi:type II secretion system protein [Amantichitinum ursilacus]|nr:type II secretion system protein [Amantichitinum ursilacus]
MPTGKRTTATGFTYIWALMVLVLLSVALSVVGPIWSAQVRREREQALIRTGFLYAAAIENYYNQSPGSLKQYPSDLTQLLRDGRYVSTMRYLRALYADPVSGRAFVPIKNAQGAVVGVASASPAAPLAAAGWTDGQHALPPAAHYADWQFLAQVKP